MKLVHLTDLHITPPGETLRTNHPIESLEVCIEELNTHHRDAELCLITGDLTHKGKPEEYKLLAKALAKLELRIHMTVGNHDLRSNAVKYLDGLTQDKNGYIQEAVELPNGVLLLLDTLEEGTSDGYYCKKRRNWLSEQLDRYKKVEQIYLGMHHGPVEVKSPIPDLVGLVPADKEALEKVVFKHQKKYGNIGHLFFGHYHRSMSGHWNNISFSSTRSLSPQWHVNQQGERQKEVPQELPQYSVAYIEEGRTLIHPHELHKSAQAHTLSCQVDGSTT